MAREAYDSAGPASPQHVIHATYLPEELLRSQAKPDDRDPQHPVPGDNALVLPVRIVNRVESQRVVTAVDLDHQADVVPADIEVDTAAWSAPNRLSAGSRESDATRHPGEIEFPQRVGSVGHVGDDGVQERASR